MTSPPGGARFADGADLPGKGEEDRQAVGNQFWGVGCDVCGWFACLSLGRGTQLAETLTTICCVPAAVIPPNVVTVKP